MRSRLPLTASLCASLDIKSRAALVRDARFFARSRSSEKLLSSIGAPRASVPACRRMAENQACKLAQVTAGIRIGWCCIVAVGFAVIDVAFALI